MKIRRLPQAIRDVDEIWLYIARHDPIAATRLVERLISSVARLADYPESGPARPEIGFGARSITVGNYLVLYRVKRDSVDIVRIVHGARELLGTPRR
ncbi:MAG: type II toxin-antitoxin system RelE/ParE family toxin [Sphingomonas taxi]|uniref:Type II toxin-antitoxin system RelE/ParE family toxin n=1 Tax=Sphingomonas taxi TaxID=1549858 RepID=A0A2W4YW33_9SPHN|nr:MAG: type II toxin-antitoxin system RelE/ParE family toxin [Sphingomonas taxi]